MEFHMINDCGVRNHEKSVGKILVVMAVFQFHRRFRPMMRSTLIMIDCGSNLVVMGRLDDIGGEF